MWLFNKKLEENVPETYEQRLKRIESNLIRTQAEVLELYTAIDIIRNKVLRKIQYKRVDESENINTESPFLTPNEHI
jgi:hypothetical protein